MFTANYPEKRTYSKYDNDHYLVYTKEQAVEYIPEHGDIEGPKPEPVNGFSYTGDQEDGSTKIVAKADTYEAFVSGLIRARYTADEVEALQANMLEAMRDPAHERAGEFTDRWEEFQQYREECKTEVKRVLSL